MQYPTLLACFPAGNESVVARRLFWRAGVCGVLLAGQKVGL